MNLLRASLMFVALAAGGLPTPIVAQTQPPAWFGFSVACGGCTWASADAAGPGLFTFSEPPEIQSVEDGGPAAQAGLQAGDLLKAIDDHSITTRAGAGPLSLSRPGERLRVIYQRGSREGTTVLTAGSWPDSNLAEAVRGAAAGLARLGAGPARDATVRFSGPFDRVRVEVRGTPDVTVLATDADCSMEIVTSTVRVRLERPDCPGQ